MEERRQRSRSHHFFQGVLGVRVSPQQSRVAQNWQPILDTENDSSSLLRSGPRYRRRLVLAFMLAFMLAFFLFTVVRVVRIIIAAAVTAIGWWFCWRRRTF